MLDEERNRLLVDSVLGELSDAERQQWQAALLASPELQAEHEELSRLWQDLDDALAVQERPLNLPASGNRQRQSIQSPWLAWGAGIAAALLSFLAGSWWAERTPAVRTPVGERFAILLYAGGGGDQSAQVNAEFVARVVQEHRDWAARLQQQQRHILSEKLAVTPGVDLFAAADGVQQRAESEDLGGRRLGGLYIVTADDLEAATVVARGCPLLKYGGVVRVRHIESTSNEGKR
jgi:hypothetical protein